MRLLTGSWRDWEPLPGPSAVTIGVFDGVHLGHRLIVDTLCGTGGDPVVLTFDPHPAEVLAPGTHPRLITTLEERLELLQSLGVTTVGVLDLGQIRHLEPREFVEAILVDRIRARALVIGEDFHFGRDRSGDVGFLRGAGADHGFTVNEVRLLDKDGIVSSTRIRGLIQAGEVAEAASLLGSRYRMSNVVVRGDDRGAGLGFPTANLRPPERKVIPGNGVYAALAEVEGERLMAAVNVGVRPTFGGGEVLVEAHLLDYHGDLYGRRLTLHFAERLRPELRFEDADSLVRAMEEDVARVRRIMEAALS